MRRLLRAALLTALIVGAFAGVASARLADDGERPAPPRAPMVVPAAAPAADAVQDGAYGYRSSQALAAEIERAAGPVDAPAAPAGGTAVTVSATVLPVVFISLDADDQVVKVATNTPSRDANDVLFVFLRAGDDASRLAPSAASWAAARAALAEAEAGTGTIWAA